MKTKTISVGPAMTVRITVGPVIAELVRRLESAGIEHALHVDSCLGSWISASCSGRIIVGSVGDDRIYLSYSGPDGRERKDVSVDDAVETLLPDAQRSPA